MIAEDLLGTYNRLDDASRTWLHRRDVARETMLMWPGPIGVADIEVHELGIFSFADAGRRAFVHPVRSGDSDSEIIDVIAWMPESPSRWWTLCNTGWAIGDEQLHHAEFWNEPVLLHPNPLAWLAADGVGAVVMDWSMSSSTLRSVPCIITDDSVFGREVQRRLTMPVQTCPEIRVRAGRAAA